MFTNRGGVAVITLDHPPVNSLGADLRRAIVDALDAAQQDADIVGVVLTGNAKVFSAGADVTEFGTPRQLQEPILPTVIARIESSSKPVVAAIGGMALGGGFELALACHGRVALATARVGLPEITLGLIPGAGGTQRLPRLTGLEQATAMMLDGRPRTAAELARGTLFNAVVEHDEVGAACRIVQELAGSGTALPKAGDRALAPASVNEFVDAQRAALSSKQKLQPAYSALLDAIAATSRPLEDGLKTERASFLSLVSTPAAQALRYQFKVEREASRLPDAGTDAALQPPRALTTIAVIGAGTMGSGIAIALLDAKLHVILLEQDPDALARGQGRILDHYTSRAKSGKMSEADARTRSERLTATLDWAALGDADLVIEAVFEEIGVKQDVFKKIDAHARPGAVLATNTSYLDIDVIAAATSRPQDVLGLHFFSPANVMKLLEVVRGAHTAPDVMAAGMALGKKLGKVAVPTGNAFGFIGNRVYNAYRRECEFMLEDGAWPEEVDQALTSMGFAMGPFAVADLSGLDIAWRMRKAQAPTRDPRSRYVDILDKLCEAGRLGRKANAGYYTYTDGKPSRQTDDVVRGLIADARQRRGNPVRPLSAEEIRRRALLAMVNEAALLVAEGVASRPSDVDVVMVQGYGFPRWEGGPVHWAKQQDRAQLLRDLEQQVSAAGFGSVVGDVGRLLGE